MKNHNIKMLFNETAHIIKYKTYSEKQYLVTQALNLISEWLFPHVLCAQEKHLCTKYGDITFMGVCHAKTGKHENEVAGAKVQ
jgi:hypothetical protein